KLSYSAVPPQFRDLLVQTAERAKIDLGGSDDLDVILPDYCGSPARVKLTVNTMLNLFQPFLIEAFETLKHTINEQARCSFEDIGCLLMVGGTSKLRGLSDFFRSPPQPHRGWPNHV